MDRLVRLKPPLYFQIAGIRDFWQRYQDDNFSMSDAISLLAKFYSQFYERCKEDFKK